MGNGDSKLDKSLEEDFPSTERYYGLYNYGNTCYANSVLQALFFCQPFRMAIMNWTSQRAAQLQIEQDKQPKDTFTATLRKVASTVTSSGIREGDPPLLTALSMLFEEIQFQKRRTGTIKPQQFISTLKRENIMFDSFNQQDAHEFLMFMLNDISDSLVKQSTVLDRKLKRLESSGNLGELGGDGGDDEEEDSSKRSKAPCMSANTFVQSIFQGTLTNETRCLTCETVTSREEHFLDVPVDIEQNSSVTHCLKRLAKVERLTGTNKFSCECCGALQEAEKRTRFKVLPKILILHLKRFKYLEHPGIHAKLSHRVTYPLELRVPSVMSQRKDEDVSPQERVLYSSSSSANEHLNHADLTSSQEDYNGNGMASDEDPLYYLCGMVVHLGPTAQSGHYIAFIRSGDKWLQMNDHHVVPVPDPDVLFNHTFGCWNHNPEEPQHSASAYILFYERRPEVGKR